MKKVSTIAALFMSVLMVFTFISCEIEAEDSGKKKESVPEGFVRVTGRTIKGTEQWTPPSNIFVAGRSITIGNLYVCDHEVTQAEYEKYCTYSTYSYSYRPSTKYGLGENYPVYYVSWYDTIVYCNLRSIDEGLTPVYAINGETDPAKWSGIKKGTVAGVPKYYGPDSINKTWDAITFDITANGYRLPTEAEWEYIAREGKTSGTEFSGSNTLEAVAWCQNNSEDKAHEVKTDKVPGTDSANALGVYDMSGNVWDWCWDWYGDISDTTDATGPVSISSSRADRENRGGSWKFTSKYCTVSIRGDCGYPNLRLNDIGFRVVRSIR